VYIDIAFIQKFTKFSIIGAGIFVFDATCFWLLLKFLDQPAIVRPISVALAIILSWWLNRTLTFHAKLERKSLSELLKFVTSQVPGACINALASLAVYHYLKLALHNPWISTAVGSCAGLIVNFLMANFFVFGRK
jgi:putative flippase GtrA